MHGDLIIHLSKSRQDDIARSAARGARRRRLLGGLLKGPQPVLRQPAPVGGMLPLWRHGSPARGS